MYPFPEQHIPQALDARRARNLFIVGLTTILVVALAIAVIAFQAESGGIGGPAGHDHRASRLRMAAGPAESISPPSTHLGRARPSTDGCRPRRTERPGPRCMGGCRPRRTDDRARSWVAAGRRRVTTAQTPTSGIMEASAGRDQELRQRATRTSTARVRTTWPGGCARPLVVLGPGTGVRHTRPMGQPRSWASIDAPPDRHWRPPRRARPGGGRGAGAAARARRPGSVRPRTPGGGRTAAARCAGPIDR